MRDAAAAGLVAKVEYVTHPSFIKLQLSRRGPESVPASVVRATIRDQPNHTAVEWMDDGSPKSAPRVPFPAIQSSFSRNSLQIPCQEKIRPRPRKRRKKKGFFAFVNGRVSKRDERTHRVGGDFLSEEGPATETRREETKGERESVGADRYSPQIGLGVAQKVIVRETRKGVDFRRERGRELCVFLPQLFHRSVARKVGSRH